MRTFVVTVAVALARLVTAYQGCSLCINNSTQPIEEVMAPWTLRGTIYIPLSSCRPTLLDLAVKAFSPLESNSSVAFSGDYTGALGMIQIMSFEDGPVGPYDELFIVTGCFRSQREGQRGTTEQHTQVRSSRIYISQKIDVLERTKK